MNELQLNSSNLALDSEDPLTQIQAESLPELLSVRIPVNVLLHMYPPAGTQPITHGKVLLNTDKTFRNETLPFPAARRENNPIPGE